MNASLLKKESIEVKRQREKVVKSRAGWRKADQVKKIKIVMTMVAVALCISVAAGAVLVWIQVKHPFDRPLVSTPVSSAVPVSSQNDVLPTYDNSYNLTLVNTENPLKSDFSVTLEEFEGVQADARIVPALKKMMEAAKADGCALKLTGGYVDSNMQEKLFQAEVQYLMKKKGFSQVRAENQAQNTIGRGGYNENQTGMAVEISAEGLAANSDFSTTSQYKWLIKNSITYGFVLRYPENKAGVTGRVFSPAHFRYVGKDNAVKMREYSMCLEEYAAYIRKQAAG